MRRLLLLCSFVTLTAISAEEGNVSIPEQANNQAINSALSKCYGHFSTGLYQRTFECLKAVESSFNQLPEIEKQNDKKTAGLIAYWQGISAARMQDYPEAISAFEKALQLKYSTDDIYYELGQAFYASEKLSRARNAFKLSFDRKYKRGVSLYYIAFISQALGDSKKAVNFYNTIQRLGPQEKQDVLQPAIAQIAEIYLEKAEKHPDSIKAVESYVIPEFRRAIAVDEESELANSLKQKVLDIQQKYDLILLKMRNGRPTLNPPYFFRLAQDVATDSNVTFTPQETTTSSSDQASLYSKFDAFGRYTYYLKNIMSVAPEVRFNRTYYFHRVPNVYRNDNYSLNTALRMAHEHAFNQKPASALFDLDYGYSERDVNAEKKLVFNSRSYTFMLGERLNIFSRGESIFRFRQRHFVSYTSASNSVTNSFVYEQVLGFKTGHALLIYSSYDRTRVETTSFDTNSFTVRGDVIFPRYKELYTPSIGLSLTSTDPINNQYGRGRELTYNPSFKVSRAFGKRVRANIHYDYMKNNSKDVQNFAYKKQFYGVELEYIF